MASPSRPQPLTVDFEQKTMINTHGVKSPTCKEGWAGTPVEMGPGNRDHWDGNRLEKLIKEKLMMRTKSGNGQVLAAFQLFTSDGDINISPEEFKYRIGHLLNTKITDEEIGSLFAKYDDDGSGEITIHEFVAGIFPNDFAIRSEVQESIEGDPEAFETSLGEVPPTLGYSGHVPGNRDMFGRKGYTRSPNSSPVGSPAATTTAGFGVVSPPTSPSAMGAYPGHSHEPDADPLLTPTWKRNALSRANSSLE